MNREQKRGLARLRKLGEGIQSLEQKHFNFGVMAQETYSCGFIGCAIGHAHSILPKWFSNEKVGSYYKYIQVKAKQKDGSMKPIHVDGMERGDNRMKNVFGISDREAMLLFMPGPKPQLRSTATKEEVGQNIIQFVERKLAEDAAT